MSDSEPLLEEVRRLVGGIEQIVDLQRSDRARIQHAAEREFLDSHAGRRQPRNLGLADFIQGHPWIAGLFTTVVPSEFWIYDREEIEISCPCGGQPRVTPGSLHPCAGCERIFLATGSAVHVFNPDPPARRAPTDE